MRVYLKGLEYGNWCWSQIGDLTLNDLEAIPYQYELSPLCFVEVKK